MEKEKKEMAEANADLSAYFVAKEAKFKEEKVELTWIKRAAKAKKEKAVCAAKKMSFMKYREINSNYWAQKNETDEAVMVLRKLE